MKALTSLKEGMRGQGGPCPASDIGLHLRLTHRAVCYVVRSYRQPATRHRCASGGRRRRGGQWSRSRAEEKLVPVEAAAAVLPRVRQEEDDGMLEGEGGRPETGFRVAG